MSKKQGTVKFSKVLSYVIIVILLVGLCGTLAYFTNGFTTDFQTFYLEYGETKIFEKANNVVFGQSDELRIDVKYTFGGINKDAPKDYTVKIVPNITEKSGSFDFTVDGQVYGWNGDLDLTEVFQVENYDDYFTLKTTGITSMKELLSRQFLGKTVECPEVSLTSECVKIIVTSYNGKASVEIAFSLVIPVQGVELSDSEWVIYAENFEN